MKLRFILIQCDIENKKKCADFVVEKKCFKKMQRACNTDVLLQINW